MKITILSGGSGNSELIKGLKSFYKDADVKVLVSAFDNGKSTGVCRKVTNTLGVSDIRKNHIRMYKEVSNVVDRRLVNLFEGRYNLGSDPKHSDIFYKFGIDEYWKPEYSCKKFTDYMVDFFWFNVNSEDYKYDNFCIGNILYSQMYKELGYKKTNKIICDVLGIDDFVVMNTYDNVYLKAKMSDGSILDDEGDIVDFADFNKKIVNTFYEPEETQTITNDAIRAIEDCDLFIISTGTFWSSIYPTLQYGGLYKYVNASKAKKIWAINNEFDKDSYGVSSNDFIDKMEKLGLKLDDFTILENGNAIEELREPNDKYDVIVRYMGNNKGKHDPELYCKEILRAYYNLKPLEMYDKIIFDFDDTLWARDYMKDENLYKISKENIDLINSYLNSKTLIISGNSYSSMLPKLRSVFGIDLEHMGLSIWTCAEASKHVGNTVVKRCDSLMIENYRDLINDINTIIDDKSKVISLGYDTYSNIRIKPLQKFEREILYRYLVDVIVPKYDNIAVYKTGRSTIDIVHKDNTKSYVFDVEDLEDISTLYIGDEIDSGNDRDIAAKCTDAVSTSGVEETNILLKLIIGR